MTETLKDIYDFASEDLAAVDKLIKASLTHQSQPIEIISNYIISAGGKRIRPLFAILSAKMFGYTGQSHIKVAAALEFIHTATLFHDDVIDDGKTRRGKPTANNIWGNKYAVLVGDFLFSQAFKLMVDTKTHEVLEVLSNSASIVAAGEIEQLNYIGNLGITELQYIKIIRDKTAELFAAACKTGAIVADQDRLVINKMYDFGLNIGIAFQIIDDILDYTSKDTGKDLGQDLKDRKTTLPLLLAYRLANAEDKDTIEKIFSSEYEDPHFETILLIMSKYDTIAQSKVYALDFISKSAKILQTIPKHSGFDNQLNSIMDYQTRRIS